MPAEAVHAQDDQFSREKLCQRRRYGFEMRAGGDEIDVGLYGVACCWEDAFAIQGLLARKARRFHQTQPFFDAAGFFAVAVVIEDAFAPCQAECGIFAAREDRGVFYGDWALGVVAVEGPSLQ